MFSLSHLVVSLFLLGVVSGFTIKRDSKLSTPKSGIETKTAQQTISHHVPIETDRSSRTAIVKREVSPIEDEGRFFNGLSFDPNMMVMPKRSAAALNKMLMAFPGFYPEPNGRIYDNEMDASNKERSYIDSGSSSNTDTVRYLQNAPQRRGQKDSKKYLRCFFNAVSCF